MEYEGIYDCVNAAATDIVLKDITEILVTHKVAWLVMNYFRMKELPSEQSEWDDLQWMK